MEEMNAANSGFIGCTFRDCNFSNSNVRCCNFNESTMNHCNIYQYNIDGCSWVWATQIGNYEAAPAIY